MFSGGIASTGTARVPPSPPAPPTWTSTCTRMTYTQNTYVRFVELYKLHVYVLVFLVHRFVQFTCLCTFCCVAPERRATISTCCQSNHRFHPKTFKRIPERASVQTRFLVCGLIQERDGFCVYDAILVCHGRAEAVEVFFLFRLQIQREAVSKVAAIRDRHNV